MGLSEVWRAGMTISQYTLDLLMGGGVSEEERGASSTVAPLLWGSKAPKRIWSSLSTEQEECRDL